MNSHKMKYLNAVAKYLESLGYEVEKPTLKHDLIDVWGRCNDRKCFVEIYLYGFSVMKNGLYGVWGQGDNEDEELFMSNDPVYGLDTRFAPMLILDDLKPMRRKARK